MKTRDVMRDVKNTKKSRRKMGRKNEDVKNHKFVTKIERKTETQIRGVIWDVNHPHLPADELLQSKYSFLAPHFQPTRIPKRIRHEFLPSRTCFSSCAATV